ncbi:MAG TPA: hypothetical protein VGJ37_19075 [Pyrinomonadaceae bacterium]|jgi:hypothetical protein
MQKWEYKIFYYELGDLEQILNLLGDEGWELLAAAGTDKDGDDRVFYLKRPKK